MIPRIDLAPGLSVSRAITGLWQIADMERDGRVVDTDRAAAAMHAYVARGLTTFDMADHYGSAELIAGRYREAHGEGVELLTKWVPAPGRVTMTDARAAALDWPLRWIVADSPFLSRKPRPKKAPAT